MQNNQEERRNIRVSRLKKVILTSIMIGILVPILLCILLFIKLEQLQKQVNELAAESRQRETVMAVTQESEAGDNFQAVISDNSVYSVKQLEQPEQPRQEQMTRVYLTFDDGPSSNTEAILDILEQYGIKAAFFVTGKPQEEYIPVYQRIVEEGHTLGMHSYSHRYKEIYATREAFVGDLERLQEYLYDTTGVWSRFYRFPGGSSNQVSDVEMQELTDYLEEENIYYLDWNVSCGDATGKRLSARQIADNVINNVGKYRTAVVLLHDAPDKTATVEALPIIIETLSGQGNIEFVPVNDEMHMVQHLQKYGE